MTTRYSPAVKNGVLAGATIADQFDLGFLFIFSGPLPASAEEALDMVADHTQLVEISDDDTGAGLAWGTAVDGVLPKDPAQTWRGTNTFDGADAATPTLNAHFYRLCAAGDDGRGAADPATGYRFQGSCGGPGSGADLVLGAAALTDGDNQTIDDYAIEAV